MDYWEEKLFLDPQQIETKELYWKDVEAYYYINRRTSRDWDELGCFEIWQAERDYLAALERLEDKYTVYKILEEVS